jgi:hypothetical protein
MKNTRFLATLAITLLPSLAFAQTYQGNLLLSSQNAVNAASAYTGVTGSLTISGNDIVDLSPLSRFTNIGKSLTMKVNPALIKATHVFPNLTDVGGGMFFYNNDSLLELSGFDALLKTGDNIDFWYNDVIQSISGFKSLHTAGWSLEFGGNPKLIKIPDFLALQTVRSSLYILDNKQIQAITGFQALQSVSWSFQIEGNSALNTLCGLYNFFIVNNPYKGGGTFSIKNNGPGLPNPTTEKDVIKAGPCPRISIVASGKPNPGGTVTLDLSAPADKGLAYQIGSSLGIGPIPIDTRQLGLSPDAILFASLNGWLPTVFKDYAGVLDSLGMGKGTINIPNLPALVGIKIHSAFITLDVSAPSGIKSISPTESISITT